jgi:peptidoglycan/LPS O-acetylase OafA/YrhL
MDRQLGAVALRPRPLANRSSGRRRPAASPARRSTLRAEIQALRAIAVALVVVYHLWPSVLPGGFVGVDVFFAISGFLITSLLLREIERTGKVSVAAFWARRARRILPAALVTVLVCAIATVLFVPLTYWQQYFAEMRASTAYVQNWQLAGDAVDYLAAANAPSPVQHFWSLSLEEQFYLVWPVLIVVALSFGRRAVAIAMIAATALSLAYGIAHTTTDPAAAYFVTPTRAWELGAGALLALIPAFDRSPDAVRSALSWVGLAAIVLAAACYSHATAFPGYAALLPVLGALTVIRAGTPTARWSPTRAMALRPVQFLGDISYSVYLWHWPLIVLAPLVFDGGLGRSRIVLLVLTILAAWITKRLVEDPARRTPWLTARPARRTFAATGAATAAVLAVAVAASAHVDAEIRKDERVTEEVLASRPTCFGAAARDPAHQPCENPRLAHAVVPTPLQAGKRLNSRCDVIDKSGRVSICAFRDPPARPAGTIALVGDSHASHWRAALEHVAKVKRWRGLSITRTGCPFSAATPALASRPRMHCLQWNRQVLDWLARHRDVHTVFVAQHSGSKVSAGAGRSMFAAQVDGYRRAWRALPSSVEHVVIIRDSPTMPGTTLACVERAINDHRNPNARCSAPRRNALPPDPAAAAAAREHSPRVQAIDLSQFFCDGRRCPPVVGGALVYKDYSSHLTDVYATTLGPFMARRLDALMRSWRS